MREETAKDNEEMGARIAALRRASGMTQKTLARRMGVKPSMIAHWEVGRRAPNARSLRSIAVALEVSTDTLLGLESISSQLGRKEHESRVLELIELFDRWFTDDSLLRGLAIKAMHWSAFPQGTEVELLARNDLRDEAKKVAMEYEAVASVRRGRGAPQGVQADDEGLQGSSQARARQGGGAPAA